MILYSLSADWELRNPITGTAGCCARAATGHAAALPSPAIKSRRRIRHPLKPQCEAAYRGQGRMGTGCNSSRGLFPSTFFAARAACGPSRRWRSPELAAGCWGGPAATVASGPHGATYAPDRRGEQFSPGPPHPASGLVPIAAAADRGWARPEAFRCARPRSWARRRSGSRQSFFHQV
jgi:hypothetical protein